MRVILLVFCIGFGVGIQAQEGRLLFRSIDSLFSQLKNGTNCPNLNLKDLEEFSKLNQIGNWLKIENKSSKYSKGPYVLSVSDYPDSEMLAVDLVLFKNFKKKKIIRFHWYFSKEKIVFVSKSSGRFRQSYLSQEIEIDLLLENDCDGDLPFGSNFRITTSLDSSGELTSYFLGSSEG